MAIEGNPPKLDFTLRDVGMVVVDVALAMTNKDMLIKQDYPSRYQEVEMASIAMLVGCALMTAHVSTMNVFAMIKAVEQLQAAQAEWSRKRTERLDWISEELR